MSARIDVLLWAQRVVGRKVSSPYLLLDIPPGSDANVAQDAFHKIARMAHPDLHRNGLTPDELELVTTAYARAAAAYQEIRGRTPTVPPPRPVTVQPNRRETISPTGSPTGPTSDGSPITHAQAMSSKALIYYRKAELCLRRGDLSGAVLQLKMAIASDPRSAFLRSALSEVMAEVGK
ncbi:MAG TPA: hypothetical protein VH165_15025 [Kofleriaceae bacterium]|nr:hypothetical protein [Kofleriaceae bacterium]